MPEWMTPLLRVLVAIPNLGFCSTRKTASACCETAVAIAQPITPPPMMRMLAWSMSIDYQQFTVERRRRKRQTMRAKELVAAPDFVKIRSALDEFGFRAIV